MSPMGHGRGSRLGIIGVHPGVFGKECANDWKDRRWESLFVKSDKEGMVCLVQGTVDRSGSTGDTHPPGSLYEYQKNEVVDGGVCKSVRIKTISPCQHCSA